MKRRGMLWRAVFFCFLAVSTAFSAAQVRAAQTAAETAAAEAAPVAAAKSTAKTTAKKGTVIVKEGRFYRCYKNGKLVKNSWVTYKNRRYYFNDKGRAMTYSRKIDGTIYVFSLTGKLQLSKKPRFVTVGEYTYYVNTEGVASTGWFTVKGKLYYADSKGRLYKNRTRDGISFAENGAAESTTASELKIVTMNIVSSITNSSMTKSQKLRACWSYVISHMSYAGYYPSGRTGWQKELALRGLKYGVGNCYGFACAFAALAYEVGYDPYIVCGRVPGSRDGASDGMTRHCWVRINWCYYDPEATYAGWRTGIYGYGSYPITHTVSSVIRFAG